MSRPVPRFHRPQRPRHVRLGRSGLHGYGLFATDFIAQDTQIIEYGGERITKAEAQRREDRRRAREAAGGDGCVYVMELTQRHDLDGGMPWNLARRINHSCAPNCVALNFSGRVWIVARRDILAGEELTYDYGFEYENWRIHPCRCGTQKCVGYIVDQRQRWRVRRALGRP